MGGRGLLAAAMVATFAAIGLLAPAAVAQTGVGLTISGPSSASGTVGVHLAVSFTAQGGTTPYSWARSGFPPGLGFAVVGSSATAGGTPTSAGTFDAVVVVTDSSDNQMTARHLVTITISPAPPPPTTTTTTTLPPPTTTVPKTTTTRPKPTTTTTRPTTTTTAATTTTTVTTTTVMTTTAAPTTTTVPTVTTGSPSLKLSPPAIEPGGQVNAHGEGCTPGADVQLSIGPTTVATAVADQNGEFSAPIGVPDLALGQYDVVAQCGPTLMTPIDLAVATSVGTDTGMLGLFFFFFLLSIVLFRRRRMVRARRREA